MLREMDMRRASLYWYWTHSQADILEYRVALRDCYELHCLRHRFVSILSTVTGFGVKSCAMLHSYNNFIEDTILQWLGRHTSLLCTRSCRSRRFLQMLSNISRAGSESGMLVWKYSNFSQIHPPDCLKQRNREILSGYLLPQACERYIAQGNLNWRKGLSKQGRVNDSSPNTERKFMRHISLCATYQLVSNFAAPDRGGFLGVRWRGAARRSCRYQGWKSAMDCSKFN